MKERPILFSGEMVRAILDGRKSVTRRVVNPQPVLNLDTDDVAEIGSPESLALGYFSGSTPYRWSAKDGSPKETSCPYGVSGDRLWVRETWRVARINGATQGVNEFATVQFKEGFGILPFDAGWRERYARLIESEKEWERSATGNLWGKWRPSIFMPRWACRIILDVVDVRVERLNDISEEDAESEGVEPLLVPPDGGSAPHVEGFRVLWDGINGKRDPWDSNPWVWVISFRRDEANR